MLRQPLQIRFRWSVSSQLGVTLIKKIRVILVPFVSFMLCFMFLPLQQQLRVPFRSSTSQPISPLLHELQKKRFDLFRFVKKNANYMCLHASSSCVVSSHNAFDRSIWSYFLFKKQHCDVSSRKRKKMRETWSEACSSFASAAASAASRSNSSNSAYLYRIQVIQQRNARERERERWKQSKNKPLSLRVRSKSIRIRCAVRQRRRQARNFVQLTIVSMRKCQFWLIGCIYLFDNSLSSRECSCACLLFDIG